MEKTIQDIAIETKGSSIYLSQADIGDGPGTIMISVDQVDLLIDWLKQAKEEIIQSKNY